MSETLFNHFKEKYDLGYVLQQVDVASGRGKDSVIIRAPYASSSFVKAVNANNLDGVLWSLGYVAKLIVPERGSAYLYISW